MMPMPPPAANNAPESDSEKPDSLSKGNKHAQRGHIGRAGTGDPREKQRHDHGDHRHSAPGTPEGDQDKVEQAAGEGALAQQVSGEQKQGDGQQVVGVEGGKNLLGDQDGIFQVEKDDRGQRRQRQGQGDRHFQYQQPKEQPEEKYRNGNLHRSVTCRGIIGFEPNRLRPESFQSLIIMENPPRFQPPVEHFSREGSSERHSGV